MTISARRIAGPLAGGDVNFNGLLDPGEVWTYLCTTTHAATTTNTVTASGQPSNAQGQPLPGLGRIQDTAQATVTGDQPGYRCHQGGCPPPWFTLAAWLPTPIRLRPPPTTPRW